MEEFISKKIAGILLLVSLLFLMLFHILVILKVLPSDIVWGGNIESDSSLIFFEMIAFIITSIFIVVAAIKADYIKCDRLKKIAGIFIWIMVVYFGLSIVGNLTAKTATEKTIFIPLSILMLTCSIRLAIKKQNQEIS